MVSTGPTVLNDSDPASQTESFILLARNDVATAKNVVKAMSEN